MKLPIGEAEGSRLEFKGREASLSSVAREVVAMLNADGGNIWVGVQEEGGFARAIEPLSDPRGFERRLLDHLVETIEPTPSDREVALSPVDAGGGALILVVKVQPGARGPYAQLQPGNARVFVRRIGDRIVRMSRDELALTFASGPRPSCEPFEEVLRRWVGSWKGMAVALRPSRPLDLELERERLEAWFRSPALSGNRRSGWTFVASDPGVIGNGRAEFGGEHGPTITEVWEDGRSILRVRLEALYWKDEPKTIWPFAFLEYPTSFLRLAARLYGDAGLTDAEELDCGVALAGISGWSLRAGSPSSVMYRAGELRAAEVDELVEALRITWRELRDEPDRIALRLMTRLYAAFGHWPDALPAEFDRAAGRLRLPE